MIETLVWSAEGTTHTEKELGMSKPSNRRTFLRDGLFVSVGATAAVLLRPLFEPEAVARGQVAGSGAVKRLRELGIELPLAPKPVAVYVPAVVSGNTLYLRTS